MSAVVSHDLVRCVDFDSEDDGSTELAPPNVVPKAPPKASWQELQSFAPASAAHCESSDRDVRWQKETDAGYVDYSAGESDRIEAAYQNGAWMMRMKNELGKNSKPREIYFVDMIQFDPAADATFNIRRVPALTQFQLFTRFSLAILMSFANGEKKWWKPKRKDSFDRLRMDAQDMMHLFEVDQFNIGSLAYTIANSGWFGTLSMLMIVLNSIYIWIDADYNNGTDFSDTPVYFIIFDNSFLVWFLLEAAIRFRTFRTWWSIVNDQWYMLDILLILLMITETWLIQIITAVIARSSDSVQLNQFLILRLFRLLRLARIVRLFRVFPKLFILVKGMVSAMNALIYALFLLFVLTFVVAVMFKTFSDVSPELVELGFGSVASSCWNLLVYGFFLDSVGEMLFGLKDVEFIYAALLILYIFVSNLTILNMLIGVLCEVIARTTNESEETNRKEELERSVLEILDCYDIHEEKHLSKEEFHLVMDNPDFKNTVERFGIDLQDVARLEGVLFIQKSVVNGVIQYNDLHFHKLLDKLNQLSSGSHATVNDMIELRNWLRRRFNMLSGVEKDTLTGDGPRTAARSHTSAPVSPTTSEHPMSPSASRTDFRHKSAAADPQARFQEAVLARLDQLQAAVSKVQDDLARKVDIVE